MCHPEIKTTDPMDLTNIYGIFHPTVVKYKFFSAVYGTFSKIYNI
jgi:hypothetical protein